MVKKNKKMTGRIVAMRLSNMDKHSFSQKTRQKKKQVTPTDSMPCEVKSKAKRNNKPKLNEIARELWHSKQSYEQFKNKYDNLREQASKIMVPGSVYKSEYGKLKYNSSKTQSRLNREMLCAELSQRGFSPNEITDILAASFEQVQSREYVAFYSNKNKQKEDLNI